MFKGQAQESIRKPAGNKDDQAPKDWDVEVILSGKKKPQLLMTFSKVGICWLLLTFFWGKESLCVLTRGDGEQLHPDLQRILELELNDYHFLCPGYPGPGVLKLSQLWKAQEIYGCLLWTWSLDMIWIDMDWYGLIRWVGFSISMLVYLLMDKPWDSWWFYVKKIGLNHHEMGHLGMRIGYRCHQQRGSYRCCWCSWCGWSGPWRGCSVEGSQGYCGHYIP